MEKEKGLYKKYEVTKLTNPTKEIDAIVLEFDDPVSREALRKYAVILYGYGFHEFGNDIIKKCNDYEIAERNKARMG